ncbi:hypothetical protein ART_4162 [Arthrobacter sp. PAMC 25486]|nr:hypothetical protein ART_4162 [Arthrobacter sp. PAMC 25486]
MIASAALSKLLGGTWSGNCVWKGRLVLAASGSGLKTLQEE